MTTTIPKCFTVSQSPPLVGGFPVLDPDLVVRLQVHQLGVLVRLQLFREIEHEVVLAESVVLRVVPEQTRERLRPLHLARVRVVLPHAQQRPLSAHEVQVLLRLCVAVRTSAKASRGSDDRQSRKRRVEQAARGASTLMTNSMFCGLCDMPLLVCLQPAVMAAPTHAVSSSCAPFFAGKSAGCGQWT